MPADEAGDGRHAAVAVEGLLGPRVARLVAAHIPAKRQLAAADPDLVLSPESARTAPRGRRGEGEGLRVAPPDSWRPVAERVAAGRCPRA
ncbi:hypothetical protein ACFZA1_26370 [Streptomyces filipinensis]|uniref:hypothetical protein n=1 Tax=Streptomyces filipinensis TaxID=66887 RepID=UPI0036EE9671